ncbi:sensor histidine kinase [Rugosimonospora acidiphila]
MAGARVGVAVLRPRIRSLIPLTAVDISIVESGLEGRPFPWLATIFLTMVTLGWMAIALAARPRPALIAGPLLMSAGGIGLTAVALPGLAIVYPAVACLNATTRTPLRWSAPFTATVAAALAATLAVEHRGASLILLGPAVCVAALLVGLIRRQNEALAEETRLAREGQARSAALDERARIAREIHDVLAHSLAALTVQLETADALLEGGRADQARQSVVRAGQLAREGLAETRRAIGALRGETLPLPELLTALSTHYNGDFTGDPATVRVDGAPRELNPDTALALYRTAQEAMTNIRKHAPGARVSIALSYRPGTVDLAIVNSAPPPDAPRPLASTGGGYGLTGLRERAELAGGTFSAGPAEHSGPEATGPEPSGPEGSGWRVRISVPA